MCYQFFKNFIISNLRTPKRVILMPKIISKIFSYSKKRFHPRTVYPSQREQQDFYWIELVFIWLILLNPKLETQVTLITSSFFFLPKIAT